MLIYAYASSSQGEYQKVLTMASKWDRRGFPVDAAVGWVTIKACAARGVWEIGAAALNDLEEAGIEVTANHYECVLTPQNSQI